jgi:WhiB family redox-sensing transcriptional regulator
MEPIDEFWRERAACRGEDPSIFFAGGEGAPPAGDLARAILICAGCQVRDECLDYALEAGPRYGIWGGLTQDELRVRRRRLRRAS